MSQRVRQNLRDVGRIVDHGAAWKPDDHRPHFCQWSDVVVSRARIYLSSSQPCATRGCPVRAVETPLGRGLDSDQRLGSALSGGSAKSRPCRADRRPRPPASAAPLFAEHKWLKFRSNYGQTPGVGQITARPLAYRAIVALKRSGAEGARQSQPSSSPVRLSVVVRGQVRGAQGLLPCFRQRLSSRCAPLPSRGSR